MTKKQKKLIDYIDKVQDEIKNECPKIGMTKIERNEVYQKAWEKWGREMQVIALFEEMSELQKVLCKILINKTSLVQSIPALMDEIADVEIMIEQIKYIYSLSELEIGMIKDYKIERLNDRIITDNYTNKEN